LFAAMVSHSFSPNSLVVHIHRVNAVHEFRVAALAFIVVRSWGFVWL
jgi:hypothetical protein